MRLRLLLPLLAVLSLAGVVWMVVRSRSETPATLLESARARREDPAGDVGLALREIEEGLRLARASGDETVRLELLRERASVHRAQGLLELSLRDLERYLAECPPIEVPVEPATEPVAEDPQGGQDGSGPEDPLGDRPEDVRAEVLSDACRAALWLGDPGRVLDLAERLRPLDEGAALVFVGQARVDLADRPLRRIRETSRDALASEDERRALRLAQRAAVFAADADTSEVAREELGELFGRVEDRRLVDELVHEAAEHLELARRAFVASLASSTSTEAVAGFQDLLLRAGADVDAVELGEVALSLRGIGPTMPVLFRTVPTLVRLGRREAARNLIARVAPDRGDVRLLPSYGTRDELLEWCTLLADLEVWPVLQPAALELDERTRRSPTSSAPPWATYFLGLCDLAAGRLAPARHRLNGVSLWPNLPAPMAIRTWLALAAIARQERDAGEERIALLQATRVGLGRPDERLVPLLAAAWDRLSELSRPTDPPVAQHWLTQALCLEPTEERFARWRTQGLEDRGGRGAGDAFELWTQATWYMEHGDPATATRIAGNLLDRYPHLAPALEVVAQAALERETYRLAVDATFETMALGWRTDAGSARLARVPEGQLLPDDRLRWMRLDPGASLGPVLRELVAAGERERAALALRGTAAARLGPADAELGARVLLDVGEVERARALLGDDGPPGLRLRLALASADAEAVDAVVETLGTPTSSQVPELLDAVDALLGTGRDTLAGAVLARVDGATGLDLGAILLRRAVLDLRTAPPGRVSDPLERAAALLPPGLPDLGRVFVAAAREDAEERRREARGALSTPIAEELPRRLLLAVLAEDPTEIRLVLLRRAIDGREPLLRLGAACAGDVADDLGASAPPDDEVDSLTAAWNAAETVRGTLALPPLPGALHVLGGREVATVALAADLAPYAAWALARLDGWPAPARRDPWALALRARALVRCGLAAQGRALLDEALESDDAPPALWIARADLRGPEDGLADRLEWLERAGLEAEDDPGLARLQAAALERRGETARAIARLEAALEARPGDPGFLADCARLESTEGRRARGVQRWNELLAVLPAAERGPFVLPALDNLRAARDAGEITESRWWTEVEALEAELPADPAPVRELARRAFETPREGHGRTLALERMERFRARTLRQPVESLRAGEAEHWTQLLARYTPDGAATFAAGELAAAPRDPDVWRAWVEALIAAERWNEALEDLEALVEVAPDVSTARLLALTGYFVRDDADSFLAALERAEALAPSLLHEDLQLAFFRGVAALRTDVADKREAAQLGWDLWERRTEAGILSQRNGRALAISLFASGRKGQAEIALTQCLESREGALAEDVTLALGNLIRAAPAGTRLATEPRRPSAAGAKRSGKRGDRRGAGTAREDASEEAEAGGDEEPSADEAADDGADD